MRSLSSALILSSVLFPAYAQQTPPPAYLSDPKFQKEIAAAKQPHQRLSDQVDHWKKAGKIAGGACTACFEQVAVLQLRSGELKDAIASATAFEQAATKPSDKAYAEVLRGTALLHLKDGKPNPDQLTAADASFKAAIVNDPKLQLAQYLDGIALAKLKRDDDARTVFGSYAQAVPASDHYRLRAQHFAENPALARLKMAPPFTVTTADGKQFTLDDMGGRVVLVDFWATWCGSCNQELPHIKKIAQDFAGQPLVIISVSFDSDAAKWQSFVDKNNMTWNQYRDADHQLASTYGVSSIPRYFTIDSDGVLQDVQIGGGSDIDGKLKKLVARAKAAAPSTAVATSTGN